MSRMEGSGGGEDIIVGGRSGVVSVAKGAVWVGVEQEEHLVGRDRSELGPKVQKAWRC